MESPKLIQQKSTSLRQKTSRQAIFNFVIYFIGLLYAGLCINILTSIQTDITYAYGYSVNQIIYTSSSFIFGAIIVSLFNSVIIDRIGVRWSLYVFLFFQIIAAWLRILLPESIDIVISGSILIGIGVGFGLNTILKFCHMWFPKSERTFYYSFLTLGTLLGSGLGPMLPYIFISEGDEGETPESKSKEIMNYLWTTTIFMTVFGILGFIFIRNREYITNRDIKEAFKDSEMIDDEIDNEEKDLKRESLIEDPELGKSSNSDDLEIDNDEKNDFEIRIEPKKDPFYITLWKDTKNLFTDMKFVKILILVTISKGSFLLLNSILVIIITNLEYSKFSGSATIVFGLACGLIGSVIYSRNISQKPNQVFYLLVSLCLALVLLCISFIVIYFEIISLFIIVYSLSCFFSYLMIPNYFALASKSHFKASLSSVNAYMMLFPQLATFLLQLVSGFFFKKYGRDGSYIVFVFLIVLYFISFFILKSKLK